METNARTTEITKKYVCTFSLPDDFNDRRVIVDAWIYQKHDVCRLRGYYDFAGGKLHYVIGEVGGYESPFTRADAMNLICKKHPDCQIVDHYRGPE